MQAEDFTLVGPIEQIEVIARGTGVRDRKWLSRKYKSGHWRKLKGTARVRLLSGVEVLAEIHWYELHGFGRVEGKIKHVIQTFR
jgi:hypothetical protein